jgi:type IV pilus assembly protein PilN
MTTNVAEVKKELELYKQKDREIKQLRQKLKTLEQRKNVIDGLEAKRFKPVYVLDTLTQKVVPERMWLTNLSLRDDRLQLSGIAVDNNTVADFMDNLETISKMLKPNEKPGPLYQRVQLTSVQRQAVRSINMKKFQLTALEQQPPPPAKKPAPKKKKRR